MKKQFLSAALGAVLTAFTAPAVFAIDLDTGITAADINQGGGRKLEYQAANGEKVAAQLNATNAQVNRNANAIAAAAGAAQEQSRRINKNSAQIDGVKAQLSGVTGEVTGQVNKNSRAIADTENRLDGKNGNFNDFDGNSRTIEKAVAEHDFGIDRAVKQGERNAFTIGKLDERISRLEAAGK